MRNVAGIAKGMSITLREMFAPTEVENYPDGPGPNRGAGFERERDHTCGTAGLEFEFFGEGGHQHADGAVSAFCGSSSVAGILDAGIGGAGDQFL